MKKQESLKQTRHYINTTSAEIIPTDKSHTLLAIRNYCNYENHSYTPPVQKKSGGHQETLNVCPSNMQETSPKQVLDCTGCTKTNFEY
jgi:hypothetical protein